MTKPLSAYFSFQSTRYGIVLIQLIQLYVQKSTSTTFPLRSERCIGLVFMYPVTLSNSGAFLNCDLSIENCAFLIVAGTKLAVSSPWPDTTLLSSGLLKYTAKPTIKDITPIAITNALKLSLFIIQIPLSKLINSFANGKFPSNDN